MTTKSPRVHTSIARAPGMGFAESVGAQRFHCAGRFLPSKLRANHYEDNYRPAVYSLARELPELAHLVSTGTNKTRKIKVFADDRFSFRRDQVLERVESFRRNSQEEPIKVYRSGTQQADVGAGFLRHVAGLWLEVHGELDAARLGDGLLCIAEDRPDDPLIRIAKARAENESLNADTPLSKATLARQYEALGKSKAEIAEMLGVQERMVYKYLQLLKQSAQVQIDVHEGRRTLADALDTASAEGKGGGRGPRQGVSPSRMAAALALAPARPMPTIGLSSAEEVLQLSELLAGRRTVDAGLPSSVQEWYRALAPEPEDIKAAKVAMRALPPS